MRFKLFIAGLLAPLAIAAALPLTAHAAGAVFGNNTVCNDAPNAAACKGGSASPINPILVRAINLVAVIAGLIAVIFIIVGGLQFIFSAGDPSKAEAARNTIIYAVVGLLVIGVARAIIGFVISRLNPS